MTENLAYYPRHGYRETHRATQDEHRVSGTVIGSSTADGGYPASRPIHPVDLHLTVLEKMGLDKLELFAKQSEVLGTPISELG